MSFLNEAWGGEYLYNNALVNAFKVFEDNQINREWTIRNVLGGMSAGFGLRGKSARSIKGKLKRLAFDHTKDPYVLYHHQPNLSTTKRRVYNWLGDVENLEEYTLGSYHPVHIDDAIKGRYCVVQLGFRSYSTVWLARYKQQKRLVAIKYCNKGSLSRQRQKTVQKLGSCAVSTRQDTSTLGGNLLQLDDFELEGPTGRHRCLVMEVTDPGLGKVKYEIPRNGLLTSVARKVVSRSAQGLILTLL
ncbi:hypothetical protein C0995_004473 [Termitomyces sp. Mi166|nr:hypothetical protein C0995_004473 [Termitomyces sp. Mi166\